MNFKFWLKLLFINLLAIFFCALAIEVKAARLYFDSPGPVVGLNSEFLMAINIDAEKQVNALSAAVKVPTGLEIMNISDGSSMINLWLERPNWNGQARVLSFAGIIPGGFSGKGGRLLTLKCRAEKEGSVSLSFDRGETKVLLNSPNGIEDSLETDQIKLSLVKGKENLAIEPLDSELPETFVSEIGRDSQIFNGQWFLVFAAQDKMSGIDHYEVREKKEFAIWNLEFGENKWTEAKSPYLLKDQKLKSYIYVKAVDKAGNERTMTVLPQYPPWWYENYLIWSIIIIGAVAAFYIVWRLIAKRVIWRGKIIR